MTSRQLSIVAALSLTSLVSAQTPPPSGFLADTPVVLMADGAAGGDHELHYTMFAGESANVLSHVLPEYATADMFPNHPNIELNAFSRGRCLMEITQETPSSDPYWNVEGSSWSFLIFSVGSNTVGNSNSIYSQGGAPQRNLYAYQAGVDVPQYLTDRVDLVRSGDVMGVSKIRGCDSYIYGSLLDADAHEGGVKDFYYASNSPGFTGSSIYRIVYDQNTGAWSSPSVYRNHLELGIASDAVIDALCVDAESGLVLLSLAANDLEKQLWLCWDWSSNDQEYAYCGVLRLPGGGWFVTEKLDFVLNTDQVTATCCDDPDRPEFSVHNHDPRRTRRGRVTAMPDSEQTPFSTAINLSAHRVRNLTTSTTPGRDLYQFNVRLTASPFLGPALSYEVEFQRLVTSGWSTFARRTLAAQTFGKRVSASTMVPPAAMILSRLQYRVLVTGNTAQGLKTAPSYTTSFWR